MSKITLTRGQYSAEIYGVGNGFYRYEIYDSESSRPLLSPVQKFITASSAVVEAIKEIEARIAEDDKQIEAMALVGAVVEVSE